MAVRVSPMGAFLVYLAVCLLIATMILQSPIIPVLRQRRAQIEQVLIQGASPKGLALKHKYIF